MSTGTTTSPPAAPTSTAGQDYTRRARRTSAVWAIIVVVVAVAAGLGGFYYGKSAAPTTSTTTVTYYDDLSSSEETFMTHVLIPEFESEYPNIKINYVNIDAGDMVTKISALVSANDVGTTLIAEDNLDIGELLYPSSGSNVLNGDLMNMTSIAPLIAPAQLIPSMQGVVNYETATYGGIYFIPFRANVQLVWLNVTALAHAGISTAAGPATYADLYTDAQTLGANSVMIQGGGAADTATQLFQWDVQFGGNPMTFDDAGDIAAMSYAYNLSAYLNPGYTSATFATYSGLAEGQYSMLVDQWPYVYPLLTGANASITHPMTSSTLLVYPGPSGPSASYGNDTVVGGDVLAIPKGATNLWAIQLFAQYLLSAHAQQVLMVDTGNPAVNSAAYDNLPSNQSVVDLAIEQALENPVFRPPVPWIGEWETLFYTLFTNVVINHDIGALTADAASANAQMVSYLTANFGSTTASEYSAGDFGPLYVS
jgi:trehalose transport system substrate-binding protein